MYNLRSAFVKKCSYYNQTVICFIGTVWFLFASSVLLLTGCKTITPEPPKELIEDVAIPNELSELIIPIEIPVKTLAAEANRYFSGLLYEDNNMHDDNLALKIWKKDPITISASGNYITYSIPLKIWLKTMLKLESIGLDLGTAGETEMALVLNFRSRVNIDENWHLNVHTTPNGFTWLEKPSLNVKGFSLPVTMVADKIIKTQMSSFASMIDEQMMPFLDIKDLVSALWGKIQEPVHVSDEPSVWLCVQPVSVSVSPLKGNNDKISTLVGVRCKAATRFGAKPVIKLSSLPKLEFNSYKGSYFNVSVLSGISYEYATEMAMKELQGKEFTFGKKGNKKLIINNVSVYPGGHRLIVKVDVSGSLRGTVFLSGEPFYDPETERLFLNDFDFDLDTKSKLLKSADWLAHGAFARKIAPYFEYDLGPKLIESRKAVREAIENRQIYEKITLKGRLDNLQPTSIFLSRNSINAIITGHGKMNVTIDEF